MIRIVRSATPAVLDPTPDPIHKTYANIQVRRALSNMQHGKCCYCERLVDMSELFPEDCDLEMTPHTECHIEHFRPKGRPEFTYLQNEWTNLLLACNTCNVNKGQKFDRLCIDPSDPDMDPEIHIALAPYELGSTPPPDIGKLQPVNGSPQGDWTITNIKLNVSTSRKKRTARILSFVKEIVNYQLAPPATRNGATLDILKEQCLPEAEYSFVARALCRQYDIPFDE